MSELVQAQADLFAGLDPILPEPSGRPAGDEIIASLPDGRTVCGTVYRSVHGEQDVQSLWEPRTVWEFHPLIGDTGRAGMDAVLAALRSWLDREVPAGDASDPDTEVRIIWPSRHVEVAPALLGHGFAPMTTLAIRRSGEHSPAAPPGSAVVVRRATAADLPELVSIGFEELRFALDVLGGTMRDNAEQLLATALKRSVSFGGKVLIAEAGGVAVGAADCGIASPVPGSSIEHRLRPGRWGYVGTMSVVPVARGTGVGRALTAAAHTMLDEAAEAGTYLYYDLANPLSSVFWPRQGYRPLWTRWSRRPTAAPR